VASALLHRVYENKAASLEEIRAEFGDEVASVLEGLAKVSRMTYSSRKQEQAEIFRRLILAMAKDMRVVVVQLAEAPRGDARAPLRAPAKTDSDGRGNLGDLRSAGEPSGHPQAEERVGGPVLQYAMPDVYLDLAQKVERRLAEREAYVEEVKSILQGILRENEISGWVDGRPKHFYSAYKKMLDQDIELTRSTT